VVLSWEFMTPALVRWLSHFDARQVSDLTGRRPPDLVVYDRIKRRVEDQKEGAASASQRLAAHQHGQANTP
jgi:hypothetical protein